MIPLISHFFGVTVAIEMIANKLFDKYIEKMEAKVGNSLYLATVFDMYMYAYIYMYHNYGQIFSGENFSSFCLQLSRMKFLSHEFLSHVKPMAILLHGRKFILLCTCISVMQE